MIPGKFWVALVLFLVAQSVQSTLGQIKLTLLHTNDVHSRIEQTNKYGSPCSDKDSVAKKCFGGVSRRFTVVEQIRKQETNVLFLDGGDQYQGTLWFQAYNGLAARTFMNKLKYDAMALGNHEFDKGIPGLVPFLKNVKFSIVSSNIDGTTEPLWPKGLVKRSITVTKEGTKIGIIGYTLKLTSWLSSPGPNLKFSDEVEAVRAEAAILKSAGVNIIIALGHAGINIDTKIAEEVPDVDIVVGGHTNTFLYTGTKQPSIETPVGPYPLLVRPKSNPKHKTLVVQAFAFGKYLGKLSVTFDKSGEVSSYSGNPILLDAKYPEDAGILASVKSMAPAVHNISKIIAGKSHVFLDGQREHCRLKECNMGDLVADAMVEMNARSPDESKWADVSMAIMNGGGIRNSIDKKPDEYISVGDILNVLPFGNTADVVKIKGKYIKEALEHSVGEYDVLQQHGRFLQLSGIRVVYDISKPSGSRVRKVWVLCSNCRVPELKPLDLNADYKILVPSFIAQGGDGYSVFAVHTIERHSGATIASHLTEYIKLRSPVIAKIDKRISFSSDKCPNGSPSFSNGGHRLIALISSYLVLLWCTLF